MKNSFNIMMATDYSSAATSAAKYALALAADTHSTIRFVHVFEPQLTGTSISFDPEKIDYNKVKYQYDKLHTYVTGLIKDMNILHDLKYECLILEGNSIRKQIMGEAGEAETDLIITGTHEAGGIREWIFGTHTWDMIRNTELPLLAIPENTEYSGIKNIVFAIEYREGEIPAIHYLTQIAKIFDADVTVLHIASGVLSDEYENDILEQFKKDMAGKVTYDKLRFEIVTRENIEYGLDRYCQDHQVDWLVMSPERTSILDKIINPVDRSTTKKMSFMTTTPLVILPDFYNTMYAYMMKAF